MAMNDNARVGEDQLLLERFCGHELFPITAVNVFLDKEDKVLNLEIHGGPSLEHTVPENEFGGHRYRPTADIWIPLRSRSPEGLVGQTIRIDPKELESSGSESLFCYYEYHEIRDVTVVFTQSLDGRYRVEVVALTQDPNHYDGSKPDAVIRINASFDLPEGDARISAQLAAHLDQSDERRTHGT